MGMGLVIDDMVSLKQDTDINRIAGALLTRARASRNPAWTTAAEEVAAHSAKIAKDMESEDSRQQREKEAEDDDEKSEEEGEEESGRSLRIAKKPRKS